MAVELDWQAMVFKWGQAATYTHDGTSKSIWVILSANSIERDEVVGGDAIIQKATIRLSKDDFAEISELDTVTIGSDTWVVQEVFPSVCNVHKANVICKTKQQVYHKGAYRR